MRSQFFTNLSLGLKILSGLFITPAHCTIGERGFWSIEKSAKADVYVLLISSQVKKVQNIFCWKKKIQLGPCFCGLKLFISFPEIVSGIFRR